MCKFGIESIDTRFSYSVKYHGRVYAHDFDSDIRRESCLVTYNPTSRIDEKKIVKKWWFQPALCCKLKAELSH